MGGLFLGLYTDIQHADKWVQLEENNINVVLYYYVNKSKRKVEVWEN